MKKLLTITLTILILAACHQQRTADQVNIEINKTKSQISKLNQKLQNLRKELATFNTDSIEQGISVVAKPAQTGEFANFAIISGTVEAVHSATIMPEMSGTINKIHVTEGQWVHKGAVLISLDA